MNHFSGPLLGVFASLSLTALFAACDSEPASSDDGVGSSAGGGGAPQQACPAPRSGPTRHSGEVQGDEVWTADTGPHLIEATLNVRGGATLTIEPCAVVRLAAGASLQVAYPLTPNEGTLIAEGSEERPILFEALEEGERWDRIYVQHPGTASLAWVTLRGGGGPASQVGETLAVAGDSELPAKPVLELDHLTIEGSAGPGLILTSGATFAPGSRELTIRSSGNAEHPFPIELGELALDALPSGDYTGNERDRILVTPQVVSGQLGIQADATIHERGVPYRIGTTPGLADLVVEAPPGVPPVVLTIEPGVVLEFLDDNALEIDRFSHEGPAAATLIAVGTAEKPIVFTSANDAPAPGDWRGIWFGGVASEDNRLEHVRLEYTGADCLCSLVSCSAEVGEYDAALIFTQQPPRAFLKDSVIAHGSGHGIVQGYDGASLDWTQGNEFEELQGCPQTHPREPGGTCPDPEPSCMP